MADVRTMEIKPQLKGALRGVRASIRPRAKKARNVCWPPGTFKAGQSFFPIRANARRLTLRTPNPMVDLVANTGISPTSAKSTGSIKSVVRLKILPARSAPHRIRPRAEAAKRLVYATARRTLPSGLQSRSPSRMAAPTVVLTTIRITARAMISFCHCSSRNSAATLVHVNLGPTCDRSGGISGLSIGGRSGISF